MFLFKEFNKVLKISDVSKLNITLFIFLSILASLLEMISIGLVVPLINLIINPEKFYEIINTYKVFYFGNINQLTLLNYFIIFFIIIFFLKNMYLIWLNYYKNKFCTNLQLNLSLRLFRSYSKVNYLYIIGKNSSELIRNTMKEVGVIKQTFLHYLNLLAEIMIFFSISILLILEIKNFFFVSLLVILIVALLYNFAFKIKLANLGLVRVENLGYALKILTQYITALKEIKIFETEEKILDDFKKFDSKAQNADRVKTFLVDTFKFSLEFLIILIFFLYLILMLNYYNQVNEIIVTYALLTVSLFRLIPSLNRINLSLQSIKFNKKSTSILYEELQNMEKNLTRKEIKNIKINNIKIKNLEFSYNNTNVVLKNINFNLERNKIYTIIGKSGSGKTTLVNILSGLIKPSNGDIVINNEINLYDQNININNNISYLGQKTFIFDDNIANNVAIGIKDININYQLILNCLIKSNLSEYAKNIDFIKNYNLGEFGIKLSGGQQQRLAIARALYKNADVLIFDEPTSFLDNEAAKSLIDTIKKIENKIIIIITHDKNIYKYADKIINLDQTI